MHWGRTSGSETNIKSLLHILFPSYLALLPHIPFYPHVASHRLSHLFTTRILYPVWDLQLHWKIYNLALPGHGGNNYKGRSGSDIRACARAYDIREDDIGEVRFGTVNSTEDNVGVGEVGRPYCIGKDDMRRVIEGQKELQKDKVVARWTS